MESHCKNRGDLPHDLIAQNILPRLPIKPLVRFKSVCKQWHSTLSSPQFAQTHFNFSHSPLTESLLIRSDNKFQFFSYEPHDDQFDDDVRTASENEMYIVNIEADFEVGDEKLVLVGCCNGLVCLGSISGCLFILWNPITREYRKYSDYEINKFFKYGWTVTWGFGYVSATNDYKIVRICKIVLNQKIRVHVFSIRCNNWRRIDEDSSHDFSYLKTAERLYRPGVLVNETLHWMGGVPVIKQVERKIMSFNLALELFDTFPHLDVSTPSSWEWITGNNNEGSDEFLCVIKGCLSKYARLVRNGEGVITILKHPGETEQIIIDIGLVGSSCQNLIGFTGSDKFFTQYFGRDESHLGIVDPISLPMKLTTLTTLERGSKVEIVSYSPTLISSAAVTGSPGIRTANL